MNEKEKWWRSRWSSSKRDWGDIKGRRGNQKIYRGKKKHTQRGETCVRSEQTKKASWTQKRLKRQDEIQRTIEDFKGVRNIPGVNSAKRRVFITKIKNQKGRSSRHGKELPMSLENSTKNCKTTKYKKKLNKKTERMRMRAASMSATETRMRWWEFQRLRQKSCKLQSTNSKQANPQTATELEPKTPKHATMRREKWWDKSSTKS